jgi:hypothetical protein
LQDLTLKKLIAETRLQSRTCIDQLRAITDIEERELQKEIDTVNVQMQLRQLPHSSPLADTIYLQDGGFCRGNAAPICRFARQLG